LASRQSQLIQWLNDINPFALNTLEQVSGDASFRKYFRFEGNGISYIAVDAPPETENTKSFVDIATAYHHSGIRVPQVINTNIKLGFMHLEDFGNTILGQVIDESNYQYYYTKALRQLIEIQSVKVVAEKPLPAFDSELLERESSLFTDWLLSKHLNIAPTKNENAMLRRTFELLSENFAVQPQVGVHRDYHSRNIMVLDDDELGIIDFQDAVIGPITYDAVSLMRDCYVRWSDEGVNEVLKAWHNEYFACYEWCTFKRWFDLTGMQRHVKASGIFARLSHRDGKSIYLDDIPRTLNYIVDIGKQYAELEEFAHFVERRILPLLRKS
jgi:aminoglycoside/choline kinase family phosphotransferase